MNYLLIHSRQYRLPYLSRCNLLDSNLQPFG
jgi:hypothetical protein